MYVHEIFIQQQPKVHEENSEYVASHRQLKDSCCLKMSNCMAVIKCCNLTQNKRVC